MSNIMGNNLTLVVMAAGIGSRYGGLKQIEAVGPGGEIILDYSVYDALKAGFTKIVFVISKAIEKPFHEQIDKSLTRHCVTVCVIQSLEDLPAGFSVPPGRVKPWGTAQAVLSSRSEVNTPFAVINADDFYGRSAFQAVADFLLRPQTREKFSAYCMVGYRLGNTLTPFGTVARGGCDIDRGGNLLSIREITGIEKAGETARYSPDGQEWTFLSLDTPVSMNIWGFTPDLFQEISSHFPLFLASHRETLDKAEYYLPELVGELIHEGRAQVTVLDTQEKWHGVTYPQDKEEVRSAIREMIARKIYPENLWGKKN
jgi:NDP-sugar pyrophosphorylase family protein